MTASPNAHCPLPLPSLMGVVNVTPDSFSDGGEYLGAASAIEHALQLADDGASILDIGGESTRPGANAVSADEELRRVMPVIEGLVGKTDAAISIDTRKPAVARAAISAGASIWNDVTALSFAPESLGAAVDLGCDIVLMHAQGDPKTMQQDPRYDDVVGEVVSYLESRIDACLAAGIAREKLIVDPGIGFGKTLAHNLALLANLDRFAALGRPVLLGASRKRFIAMIEREAGRAESLAKDRLGGSIAAAIAGAAKISAAGGAAIVRVHDVAATRQALTVWKAAAGEKPAES